MKADYTRWRQRLAGEKVVTYTEPDENDVGCYRLPVKERKKNAAGQNNGQWKTVDFKPVLLGMVDGNLLCQIGSEVVSDDRRNDAWPSFSQHPITEEVWRAVAERGEPWPDFEETVEIYRVPPGGGVAIPLDAPQGKTIAQMREENPNFDRDLERTFAMADAADARDKAEPQHAIKRRLEALKGQVAPFLKIESDEQSSLARGLQEKFLEVRSEAAKHYEAANRPLLEQQKKLREIWFTIRDAADAEKTVLGDAMGAWEDFKREAAKKAQAEAEKKQREHDAAVAAAEAANKPAPPPPPEVKPNAPAPAAQIRSAGGRAASVKLAKIVTEIDIDKAFVQFRLAPEVREVLMTLAQRAVTAGLPVDGATIEEKSKVK